MIESEMKKYAEKQEPPPWPRELARNKKNICPLEKLSNGNCGSANAARDE